jgi:hypothetical protein
MCWETLNLNLAPVGRPHEIFSLVPLLELLPKISQNSGSAYTSFALLEIKANLLNITIILKTI